MCSSYVVTGGEDPWAETLYQDNLCDYLAGDLSLVHPVRKDSLRSVQVQSQPHSQATMGGAFIS